MNYIGFKGEEIITFLKNIRFAKKKKKMAKKEETIKILYKDLLVNQLELIKK